MSEAQAISRDVIHDVPPVIDLAFEIAGVGILTQPSRKSGASRHGLVAEDSFTKLQVVVEVVEVASCIIQRAGSLCAKTEFIPKKGFAFGFDGMTRVSFSETLVLLVL